MSHALKDFFARSYGVHLDEVLPCPIGDAYVCFHSPVERERFLDGTIRFYSHYQLCFAKHDEGCNAKIQHMDREAWVMLMCFPEDAKNNNAIPKAHDTNNHAPIMVKVNLKEDSIIPHGVVSDGLPPRARSWNCPVFVVKRKPVTPLDSEDPVPPNGPLFPLSYYAPRWMSPSAAYQDGGQNLGGQTSVAQGPGEADMNLDGNIVHHSAAQTPPLANLVPLTAQGSVADKIVLSDGAADLQASGYLVSGPTIVAKVITLSSPIPFNIPLGLASNLSTLDISLDMAVPSFISDESTILSITALLYGQDGAVIGPQRPLIPYPADDSDDEEVLEIPPFQPPASCKCKARKLKEPMDVRFLRRSEKLSKSCGGFRSEQAKDAASALPNIYEGVAAPGSPPAPHLSTDIIQSIGTGFLQMQPEAVSAAVLEELE
ncbi:hypothetical protein HU200_012563 [Digitaria exilis]|uniref:Uncharacterized protein n=1 Tax=Digitaria exilis TaxID=1010633 RepID=A0A835FEH5_9POAL|nr:hypothetical protein HU200_012563 [Digitaria exilis]